MKRYNPLQLKEGEQLLTFQTIQESYRYTLKLLYEDFPAGFIDYYVFLFDHSGLRGAPLRKICLKVQNNWNQSQYFSLKIDWNSDADVHDRLCTLLTKLSKTMSNYNFDENQFNLAYKMFKDEYRY